MQNLLFGGEGYEGGAKLMFSPKAIFSTFSLPDAVTTDSKLASGHEPPSSDESNILNQEMILPLNEEACFASP